MTIKQVLKNNNVFSNAVIIAGRSGIDHEISSVMVLEATDIENWGRSGELLLTSFYALQALDAESSRVFFIKLREIGISGLVLKTGRLISDIPSYLISYCNEFEIPLISLPKDVRYETIITSILEPIIDENVVLLNRHYEVHKELTKLALQDFSMEQILNHCQKATGLITSLIDDTGKIYVGCVEKGRAYSIVTSSAAPTGGYQNFQYRQLALTAPWEDSSITRLAVEIPSRSTIHYLLLLHNNPDALNPSDYMALESMVSFLQMDLLKKAAVEQALFQKYNNLANDLLNGRLATQEAVDQALFHLKINAEPFYQVVMIQFPLLQDPLTEQVPVVSRIFQNIREQFKSSGYRYAYLQINNRITLICNIRSTHTGLLASSWIKELLRTVLEPFRLSDTPCQVMLSGISDSSHIHDLNHQVLDTQIIMNLFGQEQYVASYENLGFYKLFLDHRNLKAIPGLISPRNMRLKKEAPELWETLECFVSSNQSFLKTAETMFLHPKTIKYRMNKIQGLLSLDLNDPNQVFRIMLDARLFKLMEQFKTEDES